MSDLSLYILADGATYGLLSIGIAIPFVYLDRIDFTILGTVLIGGALVLGATTAGVHPSIAIVLALPVGAATGLTTCWVERRFGLSKRSSGMAVAAVIY